VPIVLKSGSLNLLEPSGPVKACDGIALPFTSHGMEGKQRKVVKIQVMIIRRKEEGKVVCKEKDDEGREKD
jgi:hypothetical protein